MKKYFYLLAMLAVVLGATACSDDDNHPSTNILDKPEVTVPDVKESSAVITWKAIGNATASIEDDGTSMPRYIRNLASIPFTGRIGKILCLLIGVIEESAKFHLSEAPFSSYGCV